MRKPVTEHSTTIKARKGKGEPRPSRLEPVGGGQVRRVEFEGEAPVFRREREAVWRPRSEDSIDQIHFEVDNLDRIRRGAAPRPRLRAERRLMETERGALKESRVDTPEGERRVLYTSRRRGSRVEEQRFHSGLVDRVLARSGHGPTFKSVEEDSKRGLLGRRRKETAETKRTAKDAPAVAGTRTETKKPTAAAKADKPAKADTPDVAKAKAQRPEPDFQPQCEALTSAGVQCRNSSKTGSRYCGSHQSYKPKRLEDVLDTKPRRGADTVPGTDGDRAGTGQCMAYTKSGVQCKNSSRKNSKYCASHKGYRVPSKAALEKRLDTKPRHAGAKDTAPKTR